MTSESATSDVKEETIVILRVVESVVGVWLLSAIRTFAASSFVSVKMVATTVTLPDSMVSKMSSSTTPCPDSMAARLCV